MNAFTHKPDLSGFTKSAKALEQRRNAAKAGMNKLTERQRKALLSPAVAPKEKP